jgi:hypothetical protein
MHSHIRFHRAAMEAYDHYELARRDGRRAEAIRRLLEALSSEVRAATRVPIGLEPTRSVLFRSAACIALEAGHAALARRLVARGLEGDPPAEIKHELLELLDDQGGGPVPS